MGPVKLRNSHTLLKTTHLGHTITYNHPAQCSITRITLHYTISIHMIPIAHKTSTHYTYYHHSTRTLYHTRDPHYIASLNTPQLLKQCPIDTPTPKHPWRRGCSFWWVVCELSNSRSNFERFSKNSPENT